MGKLISEVGVVEGHPGADLPSSQIPEPLDEVGVPVGREQDAKKLAFLVDEDEDIGEQDRVLLPEGLLIFEALQKVLVILLKGRL